MRIFDKVVIRVLSNDIVEEMGRFFEGRYIGVVIATSPANTLCPLAVVIVVDSGFAAWTD